MSRLIDKNSLALIMAALTDCYFGGTVSTSKQFPEFPWPPPKASTFTTLSDEYFRKSDEEIVLLRDVDNQLSKALEDAGYAEKSYYAVPDGFALASRLEQINPDGTPKPELERWTIKHRPLTKFSLSSYIRALFTSQPGYFRVIVFVIHLIHLFKKILNHHLKKLNPGYLKD
jgi:hypothetical protein